MNQEDLQVHFEILHRADRFASLYVAVRTLIRVSPFKFETVFKYDGNRAHMNKHPHIEVFNGKSISTLVFERLMEKNQ